MKKLLYPAFLLIPFLMSECSEEAEHKKMPKKTKYQRKLDFNMNWIGEWVRTDVGNPAKITVAQEADSLLFEIFAEHGGHTGQLKGAAESKENKAVYEDGDCKIIFELIADSAIIVKEVSSDCGGAEGVYFSGRYHNANLVMHQPDTDQSLFALGVLKTEKDDAEFKKIVGGTKYHLFLNSSVETAEGEDLDNLHSKVYASGVSGLYTIMENIIMMDSTSNNIYAAVIDEKKVRYFTNNSKMKKKLPLTIEKWRERFKEYRVVYEK